MGTDKETQSRSNDIMEKSTYTIRPCCLEDLEGVINVNEKELPEDYPYFFYKSILDSFPESFLVAINEDGHIIGYIMWRVERLPALNSLNLIRKGHLVSIAVSKDYRRKGIAWELLVKSMPEIRRRKISEYVLEVRVSNYGAINLYKRLGYKIDSIKKKYYRDGENAYFMIKTVNNPL
ncbi:MAG: GNAT family N-acetyltransferase [Candidatus Lokiarchaeota archaeon]|nr:GNAT family N-acetyltransferase [Candidatus Lokiarchaeota archaeon]